MKALAKLLVVGWVCLYGAMTMTFGQQPGVVIDELNAFDFESAGRVVETTPGWEQPLESDGWIRLNSELFRPLLDFQNRQSNKELLILESALPTDQVVVTFGGQARLSLLAAATNSEDKFNYMGRFPGDFEGNTATDARMLHANAAVAVQLGRFTHVYGETLFSDVFSFNAPKQGSFQVRQAYAVFGDLSVSPWYAYIGKKNVSFGDMSTLSPFSQSMVWHYFAPLHEGLGVGYVNGPWDWSIAALNGSRGIRVADSESGGKLNNLATNLIWNHQGDDYQLQLGTGFLLGTIYDASVAEHTDSSARGETNPAWDVNIQWQRGPLILAAEYVTTLHDWPTTGHAVTAYRTEAAYELSQTVWPTRVSFSWSEGIQGDKGTPFEFNRQMVLGIASRVNQHTFLTLEYVRGTGFAPLINITRVSDPDVVQNSVVAGAVLTF